MTPYEHYVQAEKLLDSLITTHSSNRDHVTTMAMVHATLSTHRPMGDNVRTYSLSDLPVGAKINVNTGLDQQESV